VHRRHRPAGGGSGPDADSRRLSGRAAGALFILGGLIGLGYVGTLRGHGPAVLAGLVSLSAGAVVAGVAMLFLPWHYWSRRASLWVVPPALALIGTSNWVDPSPYVAPIFFILLAMWLGAAQPRGTMLAFSPLFAVAYWAPIAAVPHAAGLGQSVPIITAVCVVAGECLAWLSTRLRAAQRRLREHDERRFQALLTSSSDTTVVLSATGNITYASPSALRVLRVSAADLLLLTMPAFVHRHVHRADAGRLTADLAELLAAPGGERTLQFRVGGPEGTWRDVEGVGRNLLDDAAVGGVLLNLRDVSERTELQRALTHQAFADQLTGLPNRALLRDRTEQALRLAGRHGQLVGLLLLDLNRFKEVNDTLGHHAGDALLQQVATRLGVALRDADTVARLGGDEFAVLLPQVASIEDARAVAEKLCATIEQPFTIDELCLDVDASIGVALYPEHATSQEELLRRADVAMYAAKGGRLGYVVYEPHLDEHNPRRLRLLGQLRRAIAGRELVVFYQPKADARSGRAIGLEALVRWEHPEYGVLGPDEFIPLAETTGLIRELTSYVLQTALADCRTWLEGGYDLTVAVNVSARCLLDLTLPTEIAELLVAFRIEPQRLVLEITESTLMTDPARALEILNRLHALGIRLSIDDFGTGYSSMAYLKNLPVQELKVDRSFVAQMRDKHNVHVIVRSTVDLGHNLGLTVVAEGVEDEQTWRELETLGCDTIQGYYLGRPMAASQLTAWLAGTRLAADPAG
jgi:diguanylate cyclase (GGDEF)-like protein/PAS domain S-box-containing protein